MTNRKRSSQGHHNRCLSFVRGFNFEFLILFSASLSALFGFDSRVLANCASVRHCLLNYSYFIKIIDHMTCKWNNVSLIIWCAFTWTQNAWNNRNKIWVSLYAMKGKRLIWSPIVSKWALNHLLLLFYASWADFRNKNDLIRFSICFLPLGEFVLIW